MTLMALVSADAPGLPPPEQPLGEGDRALLSADLLACPKCPATPWMSPSTASAQGQHLLPLPPQVTPIQTHGLRPELFATTHVLQFSARNRRRPLAKARWKPLLQLCRLGPEEFDRVRNPPMSWPARGHAGFGRRPRTGNWCAACFPCELPFEYLGLLAFADQLRETVPAAVAECQSAGVRGDDHRRLPHHRQSHRPTGRPAAEQCADR